MTPLTVVSVGYEQRTPDELASLLVDAGVNVLLDVRELPLSRRRGFSKTPLSELLERRGIGYCHLRSAGNPHRDVRRDPKRCLALYRQYLNHHPEIAASVLVAALGQRAALLCYERDQARCHRSILLEALRKLRPNLRVVALA